MQSQVIECWNCGQKLAISVNKLATARCGNCQQKVVMQEEAPASLMPEAVQQSYSPVKQKSGALAWLGSFFSNLLIGVVTLIVVFGGGLGILFYIITNYGLPGLVIFALVGVPIIKVVFTLIGEAIKFTNQDRG